MRRHFVIVLKQFGLYRPGDEVCLAGEEYDDAAKRGTVKLVATEIDGVIQPPDADPPDGDGEGEGEGEGEGAADVPLATLTDEENAVVAAKAKTARKTPKAPKAPKG